MRKLAPVPLAVFPGMAVLSGGTAKAENMGGMNKDMGKMEKYYGIPSAALAHKKNVADNPLGIRAVQRSETTWARARRTVEVGHTKLRPETPGRARTSTPLLPHRIQSNADPQNDASRWGRRARQR